MADEDIIACLHPFQDFSGKGRETIQSMMNYPRYLPARLPVTEIPHNRGHPESAEPPCPPSLADVPAYFYSPGLVLRFSCGPETSEGFVFGWDDNCDIVLPHLPGISRRHFARTFDGQHRPIVKDLETTYGTEVMYDGQGRGKRSGFVWIVGGHPVPESCDSIVININGVLKFRIDVPWQDRTSQLYLSNVNRFWQGMAGADSKALLGRLDPRCQPPGDDLAEDGPVPVDFRAWDGEDSEAQMAAMLLRAMREES